MQQYINRVVVLGAGTMGASIAAYIAGAGISVALLDMVPTELTEQEKKKGLTLEDKAVRNRFAQAGKDRVTNPKNHIIFEKSLGDLITIGNFEDDFDLIKEADWILEVVVERLDVKRSLLSKVAALRKPGSIVSSNTSGISIDSMAEPLPWEFRQHFMGTHFFNPPRYMKLLELIPSTDCTPEIRDFMKNFLETKLGKSVIICKDTPGFIANRVGTQVATAGLQMVEKSNFNMAELDQITGPVMGRPKTGTFRLADMVGLDVVSFVAQNIIDNSSDVSEKDAFALPAMHQELLELGSLGDKTKQGYYKRVKTEKGSVSYMWDSAKREYVEPQVRELPAVQRASACKSLDEKLATLVYSPEEDGKLAWELTKSMLLYVANKAEEISYNYRDIDVAMECGYNWIYGPFRIWDAIGLEKSVARMKEEGETIPAWIEAKLQSGNHKFIDTAPAVLLKGVQPELVKENSDAAIYHIGDDVLHLKFKTKANTVSVGVGEMIQEAVHIAEQGYAGIVIANDGKNFCIGADLSLAAQAMQSQDWAPMIALVNTLQQANMALRYSKRPVVAVPFGQTLGGGAEIVMHSSAAVAATETYMGLTEVGVGVVPASGGLTELLVRYMEYAKKAPKANPNDFVMAAWENVAMRKVSGSAHEAVKLSYLRPSDTILMADRNLLQQAKSTVLHMSDTYRPPIKPSLKVTGATGRAAIQYIFYNMKHGNFLTEYDAFLVDKVAYILSGGDAPTNTVVTEEHILQLEKEAFLELLTYEKTQERIEYMLKTGKLLSN